MAKDYDIAKPRGLCAACGRQMASGEEFVAILVENAPATENEFLREDYCTACWKARAADQAPPAFCLWQSRVPAPQEKKKLFVDDELLINFFQRLEGEEEAARISFRFVLALVLMRKKLLVYEGMKKLPAGGEVWKMRLKGTDEMHEVIDPKMDDEKIAQVSEQLGQILEGEL